MSKPFRIALTADLHLGIRPQSGDRATYQLIAHLAENPPDLLILAGDVGAGTFFHNTVVPFHEVIRMASLTPARILGLDRDIGSIEKGKRADLIVLNQQLEVQRVYIDGNLATDETRIEPRIFLVLSGSPFGLASWLL